jgi:hypothetical protein
VVSRLDLAQDTRVEDNRAIWPINRSGHWAPRSIQM